MAKLCGWPDRTACRLESHATGSEIDDPVGTRPDRSVAFPVVGASEDSVTADVGESSGRPEPRGSDTVAYVVDAGIPRRHCAVRMRGI